jgi:hypothetical protein
MKRAALTLLVASCLVAPVSAGEPASPAAEWRWVDAATGTLSSVAELEQLAEQFPDSAAVHRRLLGAQLDAGDPGAADTALELVQRGFAFSDGGAGQIAAAIPDAAAKAAFLEVNAANRAQVGSSEQIAEVPADALLVEGIAHDPAGGTLYASTIVSRGLYRGSSDGNWQPVALGENGSLAAMAPDPARGLIWIASGIFDETPGDPAYSAALGFDPAQGKVVRTLYANGFVPLGDIAVGDDGRIFAANPVAGEIHYADPATEEGFRALVGAGVFRSPQGMVKVPGRNRLIVSDYGYGLAVLDWDSGKLWRITSPGAAWLDGIDALLRHGQSLIAVQNGHQPPRILKLDMGADWLSIEKITVLEAANPEWTEPVGAAIDGNRLLYVATGQWGVFGQGGEIREGQVARPTAIRALVLLEP